MAEIPLDRVNVQRGGPSTGLPTNVEQSDLLQAIYGSHGDARASSSRQERRGLLLHRARGRAASPANTARPCSFSSDHSLATRIEAFDEPELAEADGRIEARPDGRGPTTSSPMPSTRSPTTRRPAPDSRRANIRYVTGLEHDE